MKEVNNEKELCSWFEDNFKELGYDNIKRRNKRSFPDYIMVKNGEEVKVEIETVLSNFNSHNHNVDGVDDVVCIKEDVKLPLNVISLDDTFYFDERTSVTVSKRFKDRIKKDMADYQNKIDNWDLKQQEFLEIVLDFWKNNDDRRREVGVSGERIIKRVV